METAEHLLKDVIFKYISIALPQNKFEKFFFVRYSDEFHHIRLRFYNKEPIKNLIVQSELLELFSPIIDTGIADKVIIDTYIRELERYSHNLIEESEAIFYFDSLAILKFLKLEENSCDDRIKILFALRNVDSLLEDFEFTLLDKYRLLDQLRTSYATEFGATLSLQRELNTKYRAYQTDIFRYFNHHNDVKNGFFEASSIIKRRSKEVKGVVIEMKAKITFNETRDTFTNLLPSYIHMSMNRLFTSHQRRYELTIYHFLSKYYNSKMRMQQSSIANSN